MPAKGDTGRADTLFSKLVRERAEGRCWAVGYVSPRGNHPAQCYPYQMQCAHIISRNYFAIRWSFDNAVCMCAAHHVWFTNHDRDWEDYVRYRGVDYDALHLRAVKGEPEKGRDALVRLRALAKGEV